MANTAKSVDYYLSELGRSQKAWNEYGNEGRTDLQQGAHTYANQLRDEAKAAGYDLSQYGTKNQHGINYEQYYTNNDSPAGNYDPSQVGRVVRQSTPAHQPQVQPFDMQKWLEAQQASMQQMYQQQAQQQAQKMAQQQRDSIQDLINQLKSNQDVGLRGIQGGVKDAEQSLEDRSFQQYLQARQAMANRGLAGSGLASDQDTRLLMDKQRNLAGIYRDAEQQAFQLNNQYQGQLNNAYRQLSGINEGDMQSELFSKLYKDGQSGLNDQAKLILDWFKHKSPSGNALLSNQTEQQKLAFDQFKFGNLSTEDRYKLQLEYDKLAQQGKYKEADMMLELQKIGLDATRIMGMDANGNPTLDARKLAESIRHNEAGESVSWFNAQIGAGRLEETIRSNDIKAEQFAIQQKSGELKGQADALKTMITQSGKQLSDLIALKKSGNGGENIDTQIANAQRVYYANVKSLEVLQGLSEKALSPSQAGLMYGNGSPSSTFANFQ